jgi:hypothetical protein
VTLFSLEMKLSQQAETRFQEETSHDQEEVTLGQ